MKLVIGWLMGLLVCLGSLALSQEDPGRAHVGKVDVRVIFATNGDVGAAGGRAVDVDAATRQRLQGDAHLNFKEYRFLGGDTQPIFRSYENWAQPLKPSDEVLVRFEARSQPTADSIRLDLELWLSRKKILKTDAVLEKGKPLYVLGPEWRGGRLLIAIGLAKE